jgi:hypothetical protein
MRPLLRDIISENQSAFIHGRLITENALLSFECLHFMEHGALAKSYYCAYKLDLSKAYDRVDWLFFGEYNAKDGVFSTVDTMDYDMCYHSELFSQI